MATSWDVRVGNNLIRADFRRASRVTPRISPSWWWVTRNRASSSIIRQASGLCVDGGHALEGGKGLDGFSGFLLGDAQIVEALQIDPKFGTGAEEMH